MTRTAVRPVLVAAPIAWVVALFVAVLVASRPSVGVPVYALSAAVYEIGSLICHQLPNRSFYFWGAQLPVCARCTGLYVGASVAALVATRIGRVRQRQVWDRAKELLLLGAVPTAVTLIYEWSSGNMPGHWIRAAAGFPLGAIVMLIVLAATTPESVVEIHQKVVRAKAAEETQAGSLVLLCLAAWAVPGLGHLWQGRRVKGLIFLVALPLMFAIGLAIQGRLFPFELTDPLVGLACIADFGIGIPSFIANALGIGAGEVRAVTYEYGNAFVMTAGLLNFLVVIDAYDIALGRK